MKKKCCFLLALCLLFSCLAFSGCGKKQPPSADKFKALARSRGLAVSDITDPADKALVTIHLAASNDEVFINYMYLCDEANAQAIYSELSGAFQKQIRGKSRERGDKGYYHGSDGANIFYVAYKGNVALVGRADKGSRNTAEKLFDKLGVR